MEERRRLLKQMEDDTMGRGFKRISFQHKEKREELDSHIDKLKELLFAVQRTDEPDSIEGPN